MSAVKIIVLALLVLAVLTAALLATGARHWARQTEALNERLLAAAGRPPVDGAPATPAARANLPAPVRRYFERVLPAEPRLIAGAAMSQRGEFNMAESGAQWRPFEADEQVTVQPPGFVWDGRVRLAPGLVVHVHDAYVAGEGVLQPALAGWLPLGKVSRDAALDEGELLRWLAEAPWYPTALLPRPGLVWEPIDDQRARVVLADGALKVALTVTFSPEGFIDSVRAEARGRSVGGRTVPTAWEGRWREYVQRGGLWVPLRGEVAWLLPQRRHTYWRGELTAINHRFVQ